MDMVPDRFGIVRFPDDIGYRLYFHCPNCRKQLASKRIGYSPAFRELGFDKSDPTAHRGLDGASGFIWQVGSYGLGDTQEAVKARLRRLRYVRTEYGDKWPISEFWDMFKDIITEDESDSDFS